MPTLSTTCCCAAGVRSSTTPSASRTSAAPHAEDAARLPCLTTLAPAAAATIAAIVEILTVFERSPPLPTTSTAGPPIPIGVANSIITSASPVSSSTVSPLLRSPMTNAAICAGVASPLRICPMAQEVAEAVWSSPRTRLLRSSGQFIVTTPRSGQRGGPCHCGLCRHLGPQQFCDRSRQSDWINRMRYGTIGSRPGRQPRIVRASDQQHDWRTPQDLVLELATQSHPARGSLTVQDRQVDTTGIHRADESGLGRHFEYPYRGQVGCDLASQRQADVLSGLTVRRIQQDGQTLFVRSLFSATH